ncbi:hypothetical protein QE400_003289 [Xanthomonas sacchari]|nr:hypothetical protein [Xanthomonas sacchari]
MTRRESVAIALFVVVAKAVTFYLLYSLLR